MSQTALFACSKCYTRHPFEELSANQQLCKECRGAYPIVKCTYCRSEFQQTSKGNTSTICRKCDQNVKQYGKPSACQLCNIIAAFIGSKCQRCSNSEVKYGQPVTCEMCQQMCAWNKADHKIEGKLLCWLCNLSYKRAIAKARKQDNDRRRAKKRSSDESQATSKPGSNTQVPPKNRESSSANGNGSSSSNQNIKKPRPDMSSKQPLPEITDKLAKGGNNGFVDPNSSDHVVAMTQLKEKIASLEKKVSQKDGQLLQKDKEMTELKARNFMIENEWRNKGKDTEKMYELKLDILNKKIQGQLKEIAQLSRLAKRPGANVQAAVVVKEDKDAESPKSPKSPKDERSSGSESPNNSN